MLTRRELLAAGGLTLAGRLFLPPVALLRRFPGADGPSGEGGPFGEGGLFGAGGPSGGGGRSGVEGAGRDPRAPESTRGRSGRIAEIGMWSSEDGARVWFDPVGLRVTPGTTVRWTLRRGVHTATAYHPENGFARSRIPAGARAWDSGYLMEPGATFEVVLDVEGVYDYFCRPHEGAGMAGRIVVAPDPGGGSARRADRPEPVPEPPPADGLPEAVRRTLPRVEDILRRGLVRKTPSPVGNAASAPR